MPVVEFYAKAGIGQQFEHHAFELYQIFFCQSVSLIK